MTVTYAEYRSDFKEEFIDELESYFKDFQNLSDNKKKQSIRQLLKERGEPIKATGRESTIYWTRRGFTKAEANVKRKKFVKKRDSPFSREYWMKRGLSEEEADEKRNSFRPIRKEYWMKQGFSEEHAESKANEMKKKNDTKGNENSRLNSGLSQIHLEYWTLQGYSIEDAQQLVKERQTTFSREICIEKFGEEDGDRIWKERQNKWIKRLQSKSIEELEDINKRKDSTREKLDKYGEKLSSKISFSSQIERAEFNNNNICEILENFEKSTQGFLLSNELVLEFISGRYFEREKWYANNTLEYFLSHFIGVNFWDILDYDLVYKVCSENLKFSEDPEITRDKFGHYRKIVKHKGKFSLLRSSYEIEFYFLLIQNGIDFDLEGYYPNSIQKFDFFLPKYGMFIEIAGEMGNKEYREKMESKERDFGSKIVEPKSFKLLIKELMNEN